MIIEGMRRAGGPARGERTVKHQTERVRRHVQEGAIFLKWVLYACGIGLLVGAVGILLCHALGVLQYRLISGRNWGDAFMLVSAPYLLKDFVSAAIALWCANLLRKRGVSAE